ncbi:MAG: flagellar motor switch protein FliG [Nitrospirae bacterium]|nr:flagellar motor switch protein FliG [Nitrospirota bacterium]
MELNGYAKAAIFLTSIGEEAAAEVLKHLDIKDVEKVSKYLTRLRKIKKSTINEVLKEAQEMLSKEEVYIEGEELAKKILSKRLSEEEVKRILKSAIDEKSLDTLKFIDPKTLSNFLIGEHPQTIALIISLLEPPQAAEVLTSLPEELMADVTMRIAMTEKIPKTAIEDINEVLKGNLEMGRGKEKKIGGIKLVAEILNQCSRTHEETILEKITEKSSNLAESIRQHMFVFDDLVKVDDKGIQAILREVSTEDLAIALKTSSEALKEKIFRNMSQRAGQILKEEMQTKGPVRVSDVEKAQQEIINIARRLEGEGKIILAGRGGEEFVV